MRSDLSNRRRFPRLCFPFEAQQRVGADFVSHRAVDLSADGFSMHCAVAPKPRALLDVTLVFFGGQLQLRCQAEVAHVQPRLADADGLVVGLHFVRLDPRTQAQLELVLQRALEVADGKRAGPRFALDVPAFWRAANSSTTEAVRIVNLGAGGAALDGVKASVGTRGLLSVGISGAGELVAAPVTVAWVRDTAMGHHAGVTFDHTPAAKQFVTRLMYEFLFTPSPGGDLQPASPHVGGFHLGGLVARGRHLQVWRARGQQPPFYGRDVAMLRYRGPPEELARWSARFQATGRVTRQVAHPGLVDVHAALVSGREAWLATEFVDGWSLDRLLLAFSRARVNPPLGALTSVTLAVLDALDRCHYPPLREGAHRPGVVHGDVRPECVFVRADGVVKLSGLGNPVRAEAGRIEPSRLPWLAPESANGAEPTMRSDVYQVAATFYEAITGLSPRRDDPAPPSRFNPEVPAALDAVVLQALKADPALRPDGAAAFARALRETRVLAPLSDSDATRAELFAQARALQASVLNPQPPQPETVVARPSTGLIARSATRSETGEIPFADDDDLISLGTERVLDVGATVGRYTILAKLASGGMGDVWLASVAVPSSEQATQVVVLKTVRMPRGSSSDFVELFLNEVRIAAMLNHPALVQVFDIGVDAGRPFLAMEYVAGRTLSEVRAAFTARGTTMPEALAARVVAECCAGLHSVHTLHDAAGQHLHVVHRDVTPRNIQLAWTGEVKLLDFGIAKNINSVDITNPGTVRGTIHYLSPEHVRGERAAPSFDVWALGLNLYALLTGREAYDAVADVTTMRAILYTDPPRPSEVRATVDPELERIALKALEKDVTRRYQSAAEMGLELEAWLSRRPPEVSLDLGAMLNELFPPAEARRSELAEVVARATTTPAEEQTTEHVTDPGDAPPGESGSASRRLKLLAVGLAATLTPMLVTYAVMSMRGTVSADDQRADAAVTAELSTGLDAASEPLAQATPPPPVEGELTVDCSLPCNVTVGGERRGPAPVTLRTAGMVQIEVAALLGGSVQTREVEVGAGQTSARFEFPSATLTLDSKPATNVFIDDVPVGRTPLVAFAVPAGDHELRLVAPKKTVKRKVHFEAGQTQRLKVELRRR
ncbi:MAG: protein kinase [Archangium sp.]|nr:protein kinase [Archangium sp.]